MASVDDITTLHADAAHALGIDGSAGRTRGRRASSIQLGDMQRQVAQRRGALRAPWNATRWVPPRQLDPGELDARVTAARDALARYDAANAAPRAVPATRADGDEAAFLATLTGTLRSTVAADVVGAKLALMDAAAAAHRRATYEAWDARVYRPLVEEIADAVDERARAAVFQPGAGADQQSRRQPIQVAPAVPLTLRDPLKRVLTKRLEEDALTQPIEHASLVLPPARARETLPAAQWSALALSSTPHGRHIVQRRWGRSATGTAAKAACVDAAAASAPRLYADDFTGAAFLTRDPATGRYRELDAEFPRGKAVAVGERTRDTRGVVQQGLAEAVAATTTTRRYRPVGGHATVELA
jgi:hypothetical protein